MNWGGGEGKGTLMGTQCCMVCPSTSRLYPPFQNEAWCTAFHVKIGFHSLANKTYFQMKSSVPGLALKVRGR